MSDLPSEWYVDKIDAAVCRKYVKGDIRAARYLARQLLGVPAAQWRPILDLVWRKGTDD